MYTFRANGQIYHNIRSFGRQEGKEPRHLELYFYDDDQALSTAIDDAVKRSAKKTRKSLGGLWPSFVTTHTHNILGVWARLTTSRTIMSH
jgi:hypothetical protein